MASKMVSLRLDEGLLEWATAYAGSRGVSRTELLASALASFREDCESGVPELRALARRQVARPAERGVGDCPGREGDLGHVWGSAREDPCRPCVFCGTPGRGEGGFLAQATAERSELFSRLRTPASAFGVKAKERARGG